MAPAGMINLDKRDRISLNIFPSAQAQELAPAFCL